MILIRVLVDHIVSNIYIRTIVFYQLYLTGSLCIPLLQNRWNVFAGDLGNDVELIECKLGTQHAFVILDNADVADIAYRWFENRKIDESTDTTTHY